MILALVVFIAPLDLTKSQAFQQPNRHSTLPVLVVLGIVQQKYLTYSKHVHHNYYCAQNIKHYGTTKSCGRKPLK